MKIDGAVALVTGGASGLGEATVRRLVGAGARVVIVDRDDKRGPALEKELGERARFVKTDVTSADDVGKAIDAATQLGAIARGGELRRRRLGGAHAQQRGPGARPRAVQDGHRHQPRRHVQRAAPGGGGDGQAVRRCEDGERGVIVNTASVAAFDGQIGQAAYAASKAGVVGLTLPVARDLSAVGMRVMTIAPGTMDTPMLAQLPEAARQALAAGIPFPKRLGTPDDYAKLVEHIVANGYLNGEVIRLDGALRMPPK